MKDWADGLVKWTGVWRNLWIISSRLWISLHCCIKTIPESGIRFISSPQESSSWWRPWAVMSNKSITIRGPWSRFKCEKLVRAYVTGSSFFCQLLKSSGCSTFNHSENLLQIQQLLKMSFLNLGKMVLTFHSLDSGAFSGGKSLTIVTEHVLQVGILCYFKHPEISQIEMMMCWDSRAKRSYVKEEQMLSNLLLRNLAFGSGFGLNL